MNVIRTVSVLLALCFSAQAESFSVPVSLNGIVHPIKAWKNSPGDTKFRRISGIALELANGLDYGTTTIGVHDHGDCELNPLFTVSTCRINWPKFQAVKGLVALAPLVEEVVGEHYNNKNLNLAFGFINTGLALPLAVADANNIGVLVKQKLLP